MEEAIKEALLKAGPTALVAVIALWTLWRVTSSHTEQIRALVERSQQESDEHARRIEAITADYKEAVQGAARVMEKATEVMSRFNVHVERMEEKS